MIALAAVAALILVSWGLGRPIVQAFAPDRILPLERILANVLVGAAIEALLIALVGAVDYSPRSMAILLALSGLAAIATNRHLPRPSLPHLALDRYAGLILIVAGLLVLLAAVGAFAPPSDHDTLRYHASLIRRDLELGTIRAHYGWSVYEFMPALAEMLYRQVHALGGVSAAQLLTVAWLAGAAASAAALTLRLGGSPLAASLAVLLVVAQRVSIHLSAAISVDFALATYFGTLLSLTLLWRENPQPRTAILLGLLAGGLMNVKYHGLVAAVCLGLPLAWDALRRRVPWSQLLLLGAIAALILAPLLVRNLAVAGNPLFPMFHQVFGPENVDIFAEANKQNRRGEGLALFLDLPWQIFVNQLRFDGFQFGFPFILLFLPFAFLTARPQRLFVLTIAVLYLLVWGALMPHLLRFFIPMFPILCALAACGAIRVADAARSGRATTAVIAAIVLLAGATQAMFVGSTALRRLPVVFGAEAPLAYLEQPAFVRGAHARACQYISENLKPGETYLALFRDPTPYCPQTTAFLQLLPGDVPLLYKKQPLPPIPADEVARLLSEANVRFVAHTKLYGYDDHEMVFAKARFDDTLLPLLQRLQPILDTPSARIYDGAAVIRALRNR